jgi:hypothetical protein
MEAVALLLPAAVVSEAVGIGDRRDGRAVAVVQDDVAVGLASIRTEWLAAESGDLAGGRGMMSPTGALVSADQGLQHRLQDRVFEDDAREFVPASVPDSVPVPVSFLESVPESAPGSLHCRPVANARLDAQTRDDALASVISVLAAYPELRPDPSVAHRLPRALAQSVAVRAMIEAIRGMPAEVV